MPTVQELVKLIKEKKRFVYVQTIPYKYALRKSKEKPESLNEVIIIGVNHSVHSLGDEV